MNKRYISRLHPKGEGKLITWFIIFMIVLFLHIMKAYRLTKINMKTNNVISFTGVDQELLKLVDDMNIVDSTPESPQKRKNEDDDNQSPSKKNMMTR